MISFCYKESKPHEAKEKHPQYAEKPTWIGTHQKCARVLLEKHLLQFSVKIFLQKYATVWYKQL